MLHAAGNDLSINVVVMAMMTQKSAF